MLPSGALGERRTGADYGKSLESKRVLPCLWRELGGWSHTDPAVPTPLGNHGVRSFLCCVGLESGRMHWHACQRDETPEMGVLKGKVGASSVGGGGGVMCDLL